MTFIYDKASNNYSVYSDSNTWMVSNSTPVYNTSPQSAIMANPIYDISLTRANAFYFLTDIISLNIQYCNTNSTTQSYDVSNIVVDTAYVDASAYKFGIYPSSLAVSNTGTKAIVAYGFGSSRPKTVSELNFVYAPFTPINSPSRGNSWVRFSRRFSNMYVNNTANMLFTSNSTHVHKYEGNAHTCMLSYSAQKTVNSDNLGVFFSPDGTKLFTLGATRIYQYSLATAWDISGATIFGSYLLSSIDSNPRAMCFSSNGLYCYFIGRANNKIFRLELASAFDITSAMYTGDSSTITLSGSDNGISIRTDGSVIYINRGSDVREVLLPTAYTLSSAVLSSNAAPIYDRISFSTGLAVPEDGYHVYISDGTTLIHKLNMANQWSLLSSSYQEVDSGLLTARNRGVDYVTYAKFGDNGNKLYVNGGSFNKLLQYTLSTPYTIGSATYSGQTAFTMGGFNFHVANNKMLVHTPSSISSYRLTTDWDISTAISDSANSLSVSTSAMAISPDGLNLVVSNTSSPYSLYKYTLNTANVPKSAYYPITNKGWLNAGTSSTNIASARYSSDGKFIFYLESVFGGNSKINKYTLATAWDLSTASFTETVTYPNIYENLKFSYDGRYMFLNYMGNQLRQYVLSSPWTLSGATLLNYVNSFFSAIAITPKGDKYYGAVSAFETDKGYLKQYLLSDRWNVRSSTSNSMVSYIGYNPQVYDIEFSPTGKYFYKVTSNAVARYTMSTPWDVASMVQDSSYTIPGTSMSVNSIHFDTYGNEFVMADYTHKSVLRFNT